MGRVILFVEYIVEKYSYFVCFPLATITGMVAKYLKGNSPLPSLPHPGLMIHNANSHVM